jgi:uncharacterized protein YndB with AHSA1/START domain
MSKHEVEYRAPEGLPVIEIVREFDAPRELVYRAHVDPDLLVRWLGPSRLTMKVERHDIERGGGYAYTHIDTDGTEYKFWGAVHDAREPEMITQTFGFEGAGDAASLERMVLEELDGGRTRLTITSVVFDVETRDAMLRSGMKEGVDQGYVQLDDVLAGGPGRSAS